MADIVQKLAFDVSDAIGAISRLNTELTSISGNISKLGSAFSSFNSQGTATSNVLKAMADSANNAASAFERLAKARASAGKGGAGGSGGGRGAGGGGRGGRGGNGGNEQELLDQIARLQAERNVPGGASNTSQRRYQNAITQASAYAVKTQQGPGTVSAIGANLSGNFTGQANTLANKLGQVQTAFTSMQKSASQSTNKLTIDWQTFVRVVSTQVIVRSLSQIQRAFAQSIEDAVKFQTQISEIGTIASKDFGNFGQISAKVREVSDAFNVPINTAAEAYYETISNQIGNAAKSDEFFTEAAKFSKSAVTDLASSVNLLSSAINAYGKDADETGKLAGEFFRTIELGRVRASDLANTYGRVASAAHQLGISTAEIGATIASITISGVKPAESLTQFRGAMNALIKPTEDMQAAFKKLGISSAEEGIAIYGWGGLLKELSDTTNGTAQAFSQLFPNLRGVNGAMIVGKSQVAAYADSLEKVKAAGAALNDEKSAEVLNSDAQKVSAAVNKLKNNLTVDLGGSLIDLLAIVSRKTGGFDPLVAVISHLTPLIIAGGAALTAYAGVLVYTRIQATYAQTSLTGLAGGFTKLSTAIALAYAAGNTIGDIAHYFTHPGSAGDEKRTNDLANFKAAQEQEKTILADFDNDRLQAAGKMVADLNKTYLDDLANAQAANKRMVSLTQSSVQQMLDLRKRYVEELRRQGDQARQDEEASQKRVFDTQSSTEQKLFDLKTKNLPDNQRGNAYESRSQSLARRASSQLLRAGKTGDQDGIQRAIQLWGQAEQAAEQYLSIAQSTGGYAAQNEAAQNLVSIAQKRINAEKQLQALDRQRAQALATEQQRQQTILNGLKDQAKIVIANTGMFDKQGRQYSPQEQANRAKARNAALSKLQEGAFSQKDLKAADILGLTQWVTKFKTELTNQPYNIQFNIDKTLADMKAKIASSMSDVHVKFPWLSDLESALHRTFENPQQIQEGLSQVAEKSKQIQANISDAAETVKSIGSQRAGLAESLKSVSGSSVLGIDRTGANLGSLFGANAAKEAIQGLDQMQKRFQEIAQGSRVTQQDINMMYGALKKVDDLGIMRGPTLTGNLEEYSKMAGRVNQIYQDQKKLGDNPVNQNSKQTIQQLRQYERIKDQSSQQANRNQLLSPTASRAITTAKQDFTEMDGSTRTAATNTGTMATNMERAATAAREAATASSGIGSGSGGFSSPAPARRAISEPAEESSGGMMQMLHAGYYAAGGAARGMDRIPTMLSPGEFVMNARSSRAFAPQLAAMNANPSYRANGGAVTNIGDIHVNVNGSGTANQTGRAIAHSLRRELRRGTVQL